RDSRHRAAYYVTCDIATGTAGCHAYSFKTAENFGNVLNGQPVILEILPGCDVDEVPAKILGNVSQHAQLVRCKVSVWHLDAQHEMPFIRPLLIKAVPAEQREIFRGNG